jgi:CelD/BcsL family acetyltransferase involved in cellulose biosynthesis
MRVDVHRNPDAFVELADEWHTLAHSDPAATIFHLPQYLGIWWFEFGSKCEELAIITLRDAENDDALRGVAALAVYADGVVRFVGDPDVTDYLGPLSRPEDRAVVAEEIVARARALAPRARIEFHALPAGSGWPEVLEQALKDAGYAVDVSEQDACPRISTEGGYDAYLMSLTGKLRHEIRRKERRMREAGEMTVRVATRETIDADLETFFALTQEADDEKQEFFSHSARASFFSALGAAFANHGLVRVVVLELDGKALAVDVGFSRHGTWSPYNMSFDRSRGELAPGMVLVGETIRLAAEEGCVVFDFLRGREPYKYRFGATDLPVLQLTAEPQ